MSVKRAKFATEIFDGISDNPSRDSREDDVNPDFNDYDQLAAEIIKMQKHAGKGPIKINTDGATITFDMEEDKKHQVTLGGNRTLAVSNVEVGEGFLVRLVQDGTGSRTVTWWSGIAWADSTEPILTTTAAKADVFVFLKTSDTTYDGYILAQNVGTP